MRLCLTRLNHGSVAPKSSFAQGWRVGVRWSAMEAVAGQHMWEAVLASLDVGVVLEDRDGRVLASNPSARRILGEGEWSAIHEDGWPLPQDGLPAQVALRTARPCTGMTIGVRRRAGG